LKPDSVRPSTQGRLRIPLTAAVTDHPPPICTQQSVTVPPEAGAKFAQPLLYGSDDWQAAYATLRSTNEGMTLVGEGGLEPPHPFGHRNLNPARLPIPPLARATGQE
jgi:hypothetical protein